MGSGLFAMETEEKFRKIRIFSLFFVLATAFVTVFQTYSALKSNNSFIENSGSFKSVNNRTKMIPSKKAVHDESLDGTSSAQIFTGQDDSERIVEDKNDHDVIYTNSTLVDESTNLANEYESAPKTEICIYNTFDEELEDYINLPLKYSKIDVKGTNDFPRMALTFFHMRRLKRIMSDPSAFNLRQSNRLTVFLYAAYFLKHEIIEMLSKLKHFDINQTLNDVSGSTALHLIALNSCENPEDAMSTLKILVETQKCKLINTPDGFGYSPIFGAIKSEEPEIISYLAKFGADVNYQNERSFNDSPLHYAMDGCNEDVIELLLKLGANPALRNKANRLPIHEAAIMGCIPGLKLLSRSRNSSNDHVNELTRDVVAFEHHATLPNAEVSLFKATPLHHAVLYGQYEAVKYLLSIGADPSISDSKGLDAMSYAKIESFEMIIDLLKEATLKFNE